MTTGNSSSNSTVIERLVVLPGNGGGPSKDGPSLRAVLPCWRWILPTQGRSLLEGGPSLGALNRPYSGAFLT